MTGSLPCPHLPAVRRLAADEVPEGAMKEIEHHILTCDVCAGELDSLLMSDPFTEEVRAASANASVIDPLTDQLIERLVRTPPREALPIPGDTTETRDGKGEPADKVLTWLEPLGPSRSALEPAADSGETDPDDVLVFLTRSANPDRLGMLGHYEVLQSLGHGGFGTVLKAFDEKLRRLVAIKMLSPALAATSSPRKRFLREARSGAAINHENVVRVYSVEDQPLPYLVMELVNGSTLQDRMNQQGPLELPELLSIGRQIASGLAAAHAMGVIHRDIKPGNILLERAGERKVKISDFGLARVVNEASLTQSGMILGTPLYMAPEQATGRKLDHRTDLFSLGSVLYAMASGHPPFRAPDRVAILRRVTEDTPRPLQEMVPELPDRLVAIIEKLLAKDPDDRFQTAREVADLLERLQDNLQSNETCNAVTFVGATTPKAGQSAVSKPQGRPSRPSAVSAPKTRRKWPLLALWFVPILLLGGVFSQFRFKETKEKSAAPAQDVPPSTDTIRDLPSNRAVTASTIAAAAQPDPDRVLAGWVLGQPGRVELTIVRGDERITIDRVADLPVEPFTVATVILKNAGKIDDEDLTRFGKAGSLQRLVLLSDDFHMPRVTDKGLKALIHESPGRDLWFLELWTDLPKVTDDGYLVLNESRALQTLYLHLPAGQGAFLSQLKLWKLDHLGVIGKGVPDGLFQNMPTRLPAVRILQVQGARPTPLELQGLAELPLLKIVSLVDCGLVDAHLEALGTLTKLRELNVTDNPQLSEAAVRKLRAALPDCKVVSDFPN